MRLIVLFALNTIYGDRIILFEKWSLSYKRNIIIVMYAVFACAFYGINTGIYCLLIPV